MARYGYAMLAVAVALLAALALRAFDLEGFLFVIAVAVAVWVGGRGPGILAVFLSIIVLHFVFIAPLDTGAMLPTTGYFAVFAVLAIVITLISEARHRAERSLLHAREELAERVRERTAQLELSQRSLEDTLQLVRMIWARAPLSDVLSALARLIETQADGIRCAVWLCDADGQRLRHAAAPSVPPELAAALVDGPPDAAAVTAGAATPRSEPHCSDLTDDPRWAAYRDLALQAGLRSLWSTPIVSGAGQVVGIFGMYHRLSRRPRQPEVQLLDTASRIAGVAAGHYWAQDELRRSEREIRQQAALLGLAHDAVIVRDHDRRITFWNRGAEALYGWSADEARGQMIDELLQTTFPTARDAVDAATWQHEKFDVELHHVTRDGRHIVVESRWSVQRDEHGAPLAILEINRDITERRAAETALRTAQAELAHVTRVTTLGEVTASFAHEVNQPLAAIANNANACLGLLPEGRADLGEVREALTDIVADAERASAIIDRVRGLATRSMPEKVPLRLAEVVREVIALAASESAARQVAIDSQIADDLPLVLGDRVQLQQVLLNLIVNAMDAMAAAPQGARNLRIRGARDGADGAAAISVQDSGIGLQPEQMHRLFETFYTTKPHGMGMGLAISRSIVESHGGRLSAEANRDGGATFTFRIPALGGAAHD